AMSKKSRRGLTRRQFGKLAAASTLAASGPAFLFPNKARAAGKTLKIIQWSHFVPGYDKWFDGVYTKEWGSKHDTEVIVTDVASRAGLWSVGGGEDDELGNVTVKSKRALDAVLYVRALYKEALPAGVFTWDPSSNSRGILAGKLSFVCNAISVPGTAEKDEP